MQVHNAVSDMTRKRLGMAHESLQVPGVQMRSLNIQVLVGEDEDTKIQELRNMKARLCNYHTRLHISLSGFAKVDKVMDILAEVSYRIYSLTLKNIAVRQIPAQWQIPAQCTNLQTLHISDCGKGLQTIEALVDCDELVNVTLHMCTGLADLKGLEGCTTLKALHLPGCSGLANLQGLKGCTALETLHIQMCTKLTDLQGLEGCTALETLSTSDTSWKHQVTLEGCTGLVNLQGLTSCTKLKTLRLPGCTGLTNLQCLHGRTALETLHLQRCTSLHTLNLQGCTSLRTLNLQGCTSLRTLNIDGCTSLDMFNLEGCTDLITYVDATGSIQQLRHAKKPGLG